ncbi:hypothetical protein ACA910_014376 [Epithemia clementina (nom. ined.)]
MWCFPVTTAIATAIATVGPVSGARTFAAISLALWYCSPIPSSIGPIFPVCDCPNLVPPWNFECNMVSMPWPRQHVLAGVYWQLLHSARDVDMHLFTKVIGIVSALTHPQK